MMATNTVYSQMGDVANAHNLYWNGFFGMYRRTGLAFNANSMQFLCKKINLKIASNLFQFEKRLYIISSNVHYSLSVSYITSSYYFLPGSCPVHDVWKLTLLQIEMWQWQNQQRCWPWRMRWWWCRWSRIWQHMDGSCALDQCLGRWSQ